MPVIAPLVDNANTRFGPAIDLSYAANNWQGAALPKNFPLGDISELFGFISFGSMTLAMDPPSGELVLPASPQLAAALGNSFTSDHIIRNSDEPVDVFDGFRDDFDGFNFLGLSPIITAAQIGEVQAGTASPGNDLLTGTANDDTLNGLAGNDNIFGAAGHDRLYGGRGKDVIDGGNGQDKVHGGRGRDILRGGAGDDLIFGGRGNDRIIDERGNDRMKGGDGSDLFLFKDKISDGKDKIIGFDVTEDIIRVKIAAFGPFAEGTVLTGFDVRDLLLVQGVTIDFTSSKVTVTNGDSKLTAIIDGTTTEQDFWDANEFMFV